MIISLQKTQTNITQQYVKEFLRLVFTKTQTYIQFA